MDKDKKAENILSSGHVRIEYDSPKNTYFIVRGDNADYRVIYNKERKRWSCECKYWVYKGKDCSHIMACKKRLGQ